MLDRARDDVGSGVATSLEAALHATPDGGIDALRAGGGEDHLSRPGSEQRGDAFPCLFERDAGRASFAVETTGVGGVLAQERHHRVERGGSQR